MKRIGVISDTHGTFDEVLREFLRDVDEIWHAGDIGSIELSYEEFANSWVDFTPILDKLENRSDW